MTEEAGVEARVDRIEDEWGEAVTGTRRKHLSEVLEIVREEAGEATLEEVVAWVGEQPPDLPVESVRQYATAEHGIGRDRFGFR